MTKTIDLEQRIATAEEAGECVVTLTYHEPGKPKAQAHTFISPTILADYRTADRIDRASLLRHSTNMLCDAIADLTAQADGKPTARPKTRHQWELAKANGSVPPDYPCPDEESA